MKTRTVTGLSAIVVAGVAAFVLTVPRKNAPDVQPLLIRAARPILHGHVADPLPREAALSLALSVEKVATSAGVTPGKLLATPWHIDRVQSGFARSSWTTNAAKDGFFIIPLAETGTCIGNVPTRVRVTISRSADDTAKKYVVFNARPGGLPPCPK